VCFWIKLESNSQVMYEVTYRSEDVPNIGSTEKWGTHLTSGTVLNAGTAVCSLCCDISHVEKGETVIGQNL
jgi:hypothetical protein